MADEAPQKETIEPNFTGGIDPAHASSLLAGVLSETDLDSDIQTLGSQEDPDSDDAPPVAEDQSEEDEAAEEYEADESEDDSLEDEWDEDEDYEEGDEEPELYSVKVDGEERQVTLEELLSGYSYQAHNTRTAQQLAEERKAIESETAEMRESRDRYAERLQKVEEVLNSAAPQEPDWEVLQKENPDQFAVEYAKWQRHQQQLQAVQAEQDRVRQDQEKDFLGQLQAYRAEEGSKLLNAVPAWKDPDKLKSATAEIREFALSRGFTDAELEQVIDHRAVLMMRDAMLYNRAKKGGKQKLEARGKRRSGKTLPPGTRRPRGKKPPRRVQEARRNVRSSGRLKDATEFLRHVLPDDI